MDRRPPAGFLRKLRRLAECETLVVVFDEPSARKAQREVWSVLYADGRGQLVFLSDWQGPLDGNLTALAERIKSLDLARTAGGFKSYARGLLGGLRQAEETRRSRRLDDWRERASYLRKAIQAQADGKPDLRSFWQVPA